MSSVSAQLRLLCLLAVAGSTAALAYSAAATVPTTTAARSAAHPAKAGDFDGDGTADLAVGAPGRNRVRVTYSKAKVHGSQSVLLKPDAPSHVYSMRFGTSLAMGDFNGDGYEDLAVGAPDYTTKPDPNIGDGVLETRGAVFEFLGSRHGLHPQPLTIIGPYDGDDPFNLADALAAADINRDGKDDLAVTLFGGDNGDIRIYRGSASGLTATPVQALDEFNAGALAFGDFNGDGRIDLLAGSDTDLENPASEFYGVIKVFAGRASGTLNPHATKIDGNQVGAWKLGNFGTVVAAGDINSDGYADAIAAAPTDHKGGALIVLTGGPHGLRATHSRIIRERAVNANWHQHDNFGAAVRIAKVDGDKYPDAIVGAPGERVAGKANAGAVFSLPGSPSGPTAAHAQRITQNTRGVPGSAAKNVALGAAVFGIKLRGDQFADVIAGAPGLHGHAAKSGGYLIVRGSRDGLSAVSTRLVRGSTAGGGLGASIV